MKLTVDLINQSPQFINAIRERELDLRGHKIPVIENLGATLNQFDTIDLSDNDIRKLDGFPALGRLSSILLNNNRISRIAEHLEENLPKLETLRALDFRKVSMKDKQEAKKLFRSPPGKELERELLKRSNAAVVEEMFEVPVGPSPAEIQAIKNAIAQASSLEEIERLNQMLKAGQIPGYATSTAESRYNGSNNVEEMEEDVNG
ncbi:U2 small nuclear ribonucleoprotein [Chamberlinius hualienensis]